MVNGTWATFQRIWELVDSVACYFESDKSTSSTKNKPDLNKLSQELYKIRNQQLSMVHFLLYIN